MQRGTASEAINIIIVCSAVKLPPQSIRVRYRSATVVCGIREKQERRCQWEKHSIIFIGDYDAPLGAQHVGSCR